MVRQGPEPGAIIIRPVGARAWTSMAWATRPAGAGGDVVDGPEAGGRPEPGRRGGPVGLYAEESVPGPEPEEARRRTGTIVAASGSRTAVHCD